MGVASMDSGDITGGHVKIGSTHHVVRNVAIVVALVAGVAGVWLYQQQASKADAAKLAQFDAFRALYAEKCNVPKYAGPVPDVVRDDYLTSPAIRDAIDKERAALQSGASCEEVMQALKKVDFAVPAPGAAPTEGE